MGVQQLIHRYLFCNYLIIFDKTGICKVIILFLTLLVTFFEVYLRSFGLFHKNILLFFYLQCIIIFDCLPILCLDHRILLPPPFSLSSFQSSQARSFRVFSSSYSSLSLSTQFLKASASLDFFKASYCSMKAISPSAKESRVMVGTLCPGWNTRSFSSCRIIQSFIPIRSLFPNFMQSPHIAPC